MSRALWEDLPVGLAFLSAELQKAFAPGLTSYTQSLRDRGTPRGFKVINDPIWSTVRVEAWELVVLDSPVLQRLREIHQLGLAGMVYPAAGYSRFEHTIGTLYQTQRIIESVNRNARLYSAQTHKSFEQPISRSDEVMLRLAALLHDVGHCFLSHVSERALDRLEVRPDVSMKTACQQAKAFFRSIKIPAVGEVLSALVILLPEFIDILKSAQIPYWEGNEDQLAKSLAQLVLRGRFSDRPFLNEIISGSLDADKLDYMSRDCYMAGLAMPIDTERLLEKLCVVNVPAPHLEDYMESMGISENQSVQVLAVQQGGAKVFEDFVLSRVLLYDKLYNHHKVRALEGAVVNALEILRKIDLPFSSLSAYVCLSDAQFMAGEWAAGTTSSPEMKQALDIIRRVKTRNFVRAFAFGPTLIHGISDADELRQAEIRQSWGRLARVSSRNVGVESVAFRTRLEDRAREYLVELGQPGLAEELHGGSIVVDLPDVQGIASRTKFFIGDESTGVKNFNELFRVEKWAEAYENQKITGYVFCPAEFSYAVHLAARDIIREEFELSFEPWSWNLTKVGIERLEQSASTLISRGRAIAILPVPAQLLRRRDFLRSREGRASVVERFARELEELEERFASYQAQGDEKVSKHRIQDWLLQFAPGDIPLAATLLRNVRYWNRSKLVDVFSHAIEGWAADLINEQWVPLGGPTTSSHHLNYLWPDLRKGSKCPAQILGSADELQPKGPIVFYDDNIGSGGQSITVFQQWLGIDAEHWVLNERHVKKLPEEKLNVLKTSQIRLLFATGRRAGLRELISALKRLLSNPDIDGHVVVPEEISCFQAGSGFFANRSESQRAMSAFRSAGERALSDKRHEWPAAKFEARLLGYGNHGGLNVFYYNVPTSTVTALWRSSASSTNNWMALFPRRTRE